MKRRLRFTEALSVYPIEGRTLFRVIEDDHTTTLRFDLYHCDDADRCKDRTEYLLDLSVPQDRFDVVDGKGDALRGDFSADILAARVSGETLCLVADCSFHQTRESDVLTIVLNGGAAEFLEHPPAAIT